MRTDVVREIERRVAADDRLALDAGEVSAEEIWRLVSTAPLAGVSSRLE